MGREGRKSRSQNFELRSAVGIAPQPHVRVAIVVPRHGHPVVARNRLRRLIREHLRTTILNRLPAFDIVIRALSGAYATNGDVLRSELTDLTEQLASPSSR